MPLLKPCPFCLSTSVKIHIADPAWAQDRPPEAWVECDDCYASGPDKGAPGLAAMAWNSRPEISGETAAEVINVPGCTCVERSQEQVERGHVCDACISYFDLEQGIA